jgi:nickel-type superoxide dismutase maturation protease
MREANWKDRLLFFLGRRRAFRVEGNSMLPTLADDDVVLIEPSVPIAVGDIVLVNHPYKQSVKILKRVSAIAADGRFSLKGDNPEESTDSRTFGTIAQKDIIGKAVSRLSR